MTRTLLALAALGAALLPALPAEAATTSVPPIVFTSDRDGDTEIYRRAANGALTQLTRNRAADWGAVWSRDGRKLAFVSSRDGDAEIFTMNADGTGVRQLTRNSKAADGAPATDVAPAWSPDGTRIVFASNRTGGETELWTMRADGTGQTRLTRTAAYVIDHTPVWSPDGRWIAFASNRVGYENMELYLVRPDGTGTKRLTTTANGIDDNAPVWSPDGRRIAFSSNRNRQHDLYVVNRDGTGTRKVAGDPGLDDVFPRWTPGGTALLYWTFARDGGPSDDVWIVDLDGTDRRRVVASRASDSAPDAKPR